MDALPTLRINIEHIKQNIVSHLGACESELGDAIDKQIDIAIAQYDWEGEVSRITQCCIQESIESYFKYGDGSRVISASVRDAFKDFNKDTNG